MALLSKAQILQAKPLTREVEVPEWGGSVSMRALTVRTRVEMFDAITLNEREAEDYQRDQAKDEADREGLREVKAYDAAIIHLIFTIYDPATGERMFGLEDYEAIRELSYPTINMLYGEFLALNDRTQQTHRASTLKKTSR